MPLMVGNIVVLNSGSPPMTVKAITHAGKVLCQWIDWGAFCTKWNLHPRCYPTSLKPRGQTSGTFPRSPTELSSRRSSLTAATSEQTVKTWSRACEV